MKSKVLLLILFAIVGCASLYYCRLSENYPFSESLYPMSEYPFPLVLENIMVETEEDISDVNIAFDISEIQEIVEKELSNSNIFENVYTTLQEEVDYWMALSINIKFCETGVREDEGFIRYRFVIIDGSLKTSGKEELRWNFDIESDRLRADEQERDISFAHLFQSCISEMISQINKKLGDWAKGGLIPVRKVKLAKKGKIQIAVLDFSDVTRLAREAGYGEAISSMLSTAFVKYKKFTVVERKKIEEVIQEQRLELTGITETSEIEKIGKLLNTDVVVFGTVSKIGELIVIDVRLVNTATGEMIFAERIRCDSEEELPDVVDELAKKVLFSFE